jgi:ankyrin repeat protein
MSASGKRAIVDLIAAHRLKMLAPKSDGNALSQLFAASENGDLAQTQAALDAGASVTAQDDRGMDALSWAALRGHTEIVKLLIARGAKVDARNSSDWPALGQACGQGHLETARVLLNSGANVNISFDGGKTPLMCAAYQGNAELAKLLLEHGANKEARTNEDDDGRSMTARDLAAMQGQREVVKLLDEFRK